MHRRQFLSACGRLALSASLSRRAWSADLPRDIRITRALAFDLVSKRPKMVGKNSRLGNHGDSTNDRMVRLQTNAGIEGLGNCRADKNALAALLGKNLFDLYKPEQRSMTGVLGAGSMPLWDLAGKVLDKPVYQLLGGAGPQRVPAYDGSIYFADLLPEHANTPLDRLKVEIDMGLKLGHRAFKIKVGRGAKWMPPDEGYRRDLDVLKTIRRHAGPDVVLGIDANNGYNLELTKRLLADLPDINLAFLEEMFPEDLDQYRQLKSFLAEHKLKALIADGETQSSLEPLRKYMEARTVDVFQADMNHFGFEGILTEAAWAKPYGLLVGPHNWGSLVGFYMLLHLGRAITNFYRAENDPADTDVLIADGYAITDGSASVPDAPGFGLKIHEETFATQIKPKLDLKL